MSHDKHFTFSLADANYARPYWSFAPNRWEDFGDTEKMLEAKNRLCSACGEAVGTVALRERLMWPLPYLEGGEDQDPLHRYLLVFYAMAEENGKWHVSGTPHLEEGFHAYPVIARGPDFNRDEEWDCHLLGYGLGNNPQSKCVGGTRRQSATNPFAERIKQKKQLFLR